MNRFGALRQLAARKGDAEAATSEGGGDDLSGTLSRAAVLVEDVVGAAERAAAEIRAEAEAHGEGRASVIDRERLAAELMKSLVERTDSLRSQAQELARILERAAPLITGGAGTASTPTDATPVAAPVPAASSAPAEPSLQGAKAVMSAAGTQSQPPPRPHDAPAAPQPPPPEPQAAPTPQDFEPAPAPEPEYEPEQEPEQEQEQEPERQPLPPLTHSRRDSPQMPSEGIRLLATQMAVAGSTQVEIEERLRSEFGVADADAILAEVFGAEG